MHCQELAALLVEDKLAGASLLILANKQDLAGALPVQQIAEVPFLQFLVESPCRSLPICWRLHIHVQGMTAVYTRLLRDSSTHHGRCR